MIRTAYNTKPEYVNDSNQMSGEFNESISDMTKAFGSAYAKGTRVDSTGKHYVVSSKNDADTAKQIMNKKNLVVSDIAETENKMDKAIADNGEIIKEAAHQQAVNKSNDTVHDINTLKKVANELSVPENEKEQIVSDIEDTREHAADIHKKIATKVVTKDAPLRNGLQFYSKMPKDEYANLLKQHSKLNPNIINAVREPFGG